MIRIGIDESNYSPSLSGPIIVASFCLRRKKGIRLPKVKDSKALTSGQRVKLFTKLSEVGHYTVNICMPSEIEMFGVYEARNQAGKDTISRLCKFIGDKHAQVHCDQSFAKAFRQDNGVQYNIKAATGGNPLSWAASIFAKVTADAMFLGYGSLFPDYGPDFGKGCLRNKDKALLRAVGPTPFHRKYGYAKDWWESLLDPRNEVMKHEDE